MYRLSSICLLLAILSACETVGSRFDIAKVSALEPGVTTEADARRLLGQPASENHNPSNSHELLVWQFVSGSLGGGSGSLLAVSFDENGRMLEIVQKTQI